MWSLTITSSSFASALRQALPRDPVERLVESSPEAVEKLVDLDRADDERRRQRQYVAWYRADKKAFLLGESDGEGLFSPRTPG